MAGQCWNDICYYRQLFKGPAARRSSRAQSSTHVIPIARLYARVSTNDQQTLAMQNRAMREYAARRGWTIALQVREVNSGAARREARETVLEAAVAGRSTWCWCGGWTAGADP